MLDTSPVASNLLDGVNLRMGSLTSCNSLRILVLTVDPGYPLSGVFIRGFPPNKKKTRQGTPTQLTCRGALNGYPKISAFTSSLLS
jgi:hypothetical protein